MKRHLPSVIAVLLTFPSFPLLAQAASGTIQVITSFSYGSADDTIPNGINNHGDVAGQIRRGLLTEGFVRFADGTFSSPLDEPDASANYTAATGLNNHELVCGNFVGSDGYHGFFLQRGTYTQFDLGAISLISGLNNAGDFVGFFRIDDSGPAKGFASIDRNILTIEVPGTTDTIVYGINNSGEMVGVASDGTSGGGFFRDADGNFTYPINPRDQSLLIYLELMTRGG